MMTSNVWHCFCTYCTTKYSIITSHSGVGWIRWAEL